MHAILFVLLAALPVPDASARLQAETLIQDVYGDQLAAAKSAEEKSKLAREIFDVAKQEPDAANKYVGFQKAQSLAVEALDGALALEILEAHVAAFEPEHALKSEELLPEADRAWDEAERLRGSEQLANRLDAVELYLRAGVKSPLIAKKWEPRIEQIRSGGAIVLRAKDAKVHAGRAAYVSQFDAICYWKDPKEWFEWETPLASGRYRVEVEYGALGLGAASAFSITVFRTNAVKPTEGLVFSLQSTGNWREFRSRAVGVLTIHDEATYRIAFRVVRPKSPDGLINLRSLRFIPIR